MPQSAPKTKQLDAILPKQQYVRQGQFSAPSNTDAAACMANCNGHCAG